MEYDVPLESVWHMTRTQVRDVFFRPRDRDGQLVKQQESPPGPDNTMRDLYRWRGWPEWRIEALERAAEA